MSERCETVEISALIFLVKSQLIWMKYDVLLRYVDLIKLIAILFCMIISKEDTLSQVILILA